MTRDGVATLVRASSVEEVKLSSIPNLPMPLGFVNWEGQAYYVGRNPSRNWRQGLSRHNVSVNPPLPWEHITRYVMPRLIRSLPSFKEALETSETKNTYVAFHRQLKVGKGCVLNRYEEKVGVVINSLIHFLPHYQYLNAVVNKEDIYG